MSLRTGDAAPKQIALDITPLTAGDVNLSASTAGSICVRRPDGTTDTWAATMSNQTANTLRLTHDVVVTDFTVAGTYSFYALLTFPSGTLKSDPVFEIVKDPFD